jgi:hypothetical protein
MKKTILLLCLAVGAKAQVKTLPFDKKVPAGVSVKGKVSDAIKWQDQTGENIVFLSVERKQVTGVDTPSGDAQTAKVHAYQYNKQGDKYQLVWELKDGIDECPLDVAATFIPKSLQVSDVDANQKGEVSFLYKTACRGDVSPASLKLLIYEQKNKYILRGDTYVKMIKEGGKFTVDKSFTTAPKGFLDFAKKQWNKFKVEESFE